MKGFAVETSLLFQARNIADCIVCTSLLPASPFGESELRTPEAGDGWLTFVFLSALPSMPVLPASSQAPELSVCTFAGKSISKATSGISWSAQPLPYRNACLATPHERQLR